MHNNKIPYDDDTIIQTNETKTEESKHPCKKYKY